MLTIATFTSTVAQARDRDVLQPVQTGNESFRFVRGNYVIDFPGKQTVVEVTPAPSDHDNMSFVVSVLNAGAAPINFGTSNISVEGTRSPVRLMTRAEMVRKAEHRAGWAKFFTGLGGALAAASEAGQRDYYSVSGVSSFGFFNAEVSAPCYSCQANAGATMALTDIRLARIEGSLDETRNALAQQALQLTTVDPGQIYGGRIFLSKFKHDNGDRVRLIVTVGEESFTFGFRFVPEGTPPPAYHMAPTSRPATLAAVAIPATGKAPSPPIAQRAAMPPRVVPASAVSMKPAPERLAATVTDVSAETRTKWHSYYAALVANGASKRQAKDMADGEFGSID